MSMTDLEIDEAIREAWTIVQSGWASASPLARQLAAALLAVTGDTPAHSRWVTPNDLWRDRLAVLAEQGALAGGLGAAARRAGLPGAPCPAAGKPDAPRERLLAVALDGADHPSCHQRGQNGTQASIAIPAPQ
jgi:hypothetical protein